MLCKFCRVEDVRILKSGKLSEFCSRKCANRHNSISTREISKITCMEKYGVDNPSKSSVIKEKKIATCQKNFGVDFPGLSDEIKDKRYITCLEKYGVKNPAGLASIKQKGRDTCLFKYGVDNISKLSSMKEYLSTDALHRWKDNKDEILGLRKSTNILKYGVEWNSQRPEHKELCIKTSLQKYGTEWPMQNDDVHDKSTRNSKLVRDYILPSGKIVRIQGYEHWAIELLLKSYSEDSLLFSNKDKPKIRYIFEGKNKLYRPDIFILEDNLIIEVKSTWTFEKNKEQNLEKEKACIEAGYAFRFMIFDHKGKLLNDN
jgi:hypothetical protein